MIYQMWRLSEAGEENLGLACTADGLVAHRLLSGATRIVSCVTGARSNGYSGVPMWQSLTSIESCPDSQR